MTNQTEIEHSYYYYHTSQMQSEILFIKKEKMMYVNERVYYDDYDMMRERDMVIEIENMDEQIKNIYESSKYLTGQINVSDGNILNLEYTKNWKYLYLSNMEKKTINMEDYRIRWDELSSYETIKMVSKAWNVTYGMPLNFIKENLKKNNLHYDKDV